MVLLSTAFQYSRTTGLSHHEVSTFHRAIGSIDPVNAPEMDSGAPPGPRGTSIAAGGELRRGNEAARARPRPPRRPGFPPAPPRAVSAHPPPPATGPPQDRRPAPS